MHVRVFAVAPLPMPHRLVLLRALRLAVWLLVGGGVGGGMCPVWSLCCLLWASVLWLLLFAFVPCPFSALCSCVAAVLALSAVPSGSLLLVFCSCRVLMPFPAFSVLLLHATVGLLCSLQACKRPSFIHRP
jgi:hypothetical protein